VQGIRVKEEGYRPPHVSATHSGPFEPQSQVIFFLGKRGNFCQKSYKRGNGSKNWVGITLEGTREDPPVCVSDTARETPKPLRSEGGTA